MLGFESKLFRFILHIGTPLTAEPFLFNSTVHLVTLPFIPSNWEECWPTSNKSDQGQKSQW